MGLYIPVDDSFLVSMLDRQADGNEQFQPLGQRQTGLIAIGCERDSIYQFHHKVGPTRIGGSYIQ